MQAQALLVPVVLGGVRQEQGYVVVGGRARQCAQCIELVQIVARPMMGRMAQQAVSKLAMLSAGHT